MTDEPDVDGSMVDLSEIESEIGPEPDIDEPIDEPGEGEVGLELEIGEDSVSLGNIYVNLITIIASELMESYGGGDGFISESGELDTTLAEQLQLDTYANQVAAKHSIEAMSPEQALVLSTFMFFGAVVVSEPEIIDGLREAIQ